MTDAEPTTPGAEPTRPAAEPTRPAAEPTRPAADPTRPAADGTPDGSQTPDAARQLRSHQWYGTEGLRSFSHRARTRQLGYLPEEHLGKPVIAILNTWSDINPCHVHLRDRAQAVKRGVWQAGGFPLEFPVSTLSETFQKPTPMLYRNMLAMETEELLRSYPVDGAVLMGGCDKSTPALLMGAASVDLPAIFVPAGPMLPGHWRNEVLGSGTDMWKYWDDKRAGLIGDCEMTELESGLARSPGHCMTMGTASTLTAAAEALGVTVPGASSIPAVDSGHDRMAAASGLRIVELVRQDRKLSDILTADAFEDAVTTVLGLGGSTNAVIHLIAMAGRAGVRLTLDDFDRIARTVPVLANVRPGGRTYLMEDFHFAGGLPGFLSRITDLLHLDRPTVSYDSMREQLASAQVHNDDVIRTRQNPVAAEGGVAVLRGNLCPDGAVIKHIAAEPHLLKHTGPAVVFDDYRTMQRTINDPELGITADTVLVLRNSGPKGGPGMPEYGMLPIPDHLLKQGVRDMLRISDARMSGTSYGACVLHVAPESYIGGPLALVRTGDTITLDVESRALQLNVDDEELARRRAEWTAPPERYERGYGALYNEQITQADTGCDFAFLARPGKVQDPYAG
jgi:dihydroxy-acid dehydratase